MTSGAPKNPVIISATAKMIIMTKAIKPTTDFSLIELLSQKS